ncbi:MAG: DMT family transporter, partial [Ruminococcus sp.]
PLHCDKKSAGALLLRATMGTVGIFCNFYAIDHLPISDASMLNKMSPFFSVLLAWLLLKERITWKQVCIICGAFIGSLFIIKPTFSNLSLFPSCIGLLGGFGAGFAYTMVRYLGTRHVPKAWIIFLFSAFSCLVALPWLLLHYEPMTWKQLLSLIGAGLAAAGGQFGVTNAYFYAAPKDISVYDYTQIIFAALLGFFLFQQVPDGYSILGYCIIIGMAVCMFFYHKRAESHTA